MLSVEPTFDTAIEHRAAIDPDGVALRVGLRTRYTYAQFARDIRRATAWLATERIAPGSRVVVQLTDAYHHWLLMFACEALGLVAVPENPAAALDQDRLDQYRAAHVLSHRPRPPGTRTAWRQLGGTWGPMLRMTADRPLPARDRRPDDPIMILQSSGTTGIAKLVAIDRAMVERRIASGLATYATYPPGGTMCLIPTQTFGGFFISIISWLVGRTIVAPTGESDFAPMLASGMVDRLFAAPAHLAMLVGRLDPAMPRPAGMSILVGGGSLPGPLADVVRRQLTKDILIGYGSTEAGMISQGPAGSAAELAVSAARVLPGMEVRIVDDAGVPLPSGALGEITLRGGTVVDGYADTPGQSDRYFRDGWYRPGDLGRLGDDGVLTVEGRIDEVMNIAGRKMLPGVIEQRMLSHPGVRDAAAVTVENGDLAGAALWIAYVADADPPAALLDAAAAELARPHGIRLAAIPRNAMGKIDRAKLRSLIRRRTAEPSGDPTASINGQGEYA